jgi:hypothetical protein
VYQVWFVTTASSITEGYYVGAQSREKAQALGANEFGCDFIAVQVDKVEGQESVVDGVLRVWDAQCFLCGDIFRTVHSPLIVPPTCDSCRKTRPGTRQLHGNNL